MTTMLVFTAGYFLGGVTALLVLGLGVAARNGDRLRSPQAHQAATHEEAARGYTDRS
jgi:hypothetical protein